MPELIEPIEKTFEIKCAHCFIQLKIDDPERKHLIFCSDQCRLTGRSFPDEKTMRARQATAEWRKNNKEKVQAYALKSYHKNKKLSGLPRGRKKRIAVDKSAE